MQGVVGGHLYAGLGRRHQRQPSAAACDLPDLLGSWGQGLASQLGARHICGAGLAALCASLWRQGRQSTRLPASSHPGPPSPSSKPPRQQQQERVRLRRCRLAKPTCWQTLSDGLLMSASLLAPIISSSVDLVGAASGCCRWSGPAPGRPSSALDGEPATLAASISARTFRPSIWRRLVGGGGGVGGLQELGART